ncbi:hypothetical protein EDB83DRAFT_2531810 [Lactarius deliciosus]|nr:hypothetical protein EDB83DRAFT_2531810 [Lactarius deliciosus]
MGQIFSGLQRFGINLDALIVDERTRTTYNAAARYRVRVTVHLGTAAALALSGYAGMFAAALTVTADWRFARDAFLAHRPPLDKLLLPSYPDASDESKGTWRNHFENPTTVQFDHVSRNRAAV